MIDGSVHAAAYITPRLTTDNEDAGSTRLAADEAEARSSMPTADC